ncbi:uncharacterized protein [Ptychodera flava]|uniref:uncharacterized protein n=1 Tax=Ptychodera flava TaxID=63121 RepID=UPI00396A2066
MISLTSTSDCLHYAVSHVEVEIPKMHIARCRMCFQAKSLARASNKHRIIYIMVTVSLLTWTIILMSSGYLEDVSWHKGLYGHSAFDSRPQEKRSHINEFPWIQRRKCLPNFYTNRRRRSSNVGPEESMWPPTDYYKNGTVVFLHHHKAAGSSVRQCISDMKPLISLKTVSHESYSGIFKSLRSNDTFIFKVYVGGYTFGLCDFVSDRPCSYFTLLRDPYERVISAYEYCRMYTSDHICWGKKATASSLQDWVKYHKSFFFYQLLFRPEFCQPTSNIEARPLGQVHQKVLPCWYIQQALIDSEVNDDAKRIMLDYILANLENWFAVIGLTDEYEMSLRLLENAFSLPFNRCHSMNLKGNITKSLTERDISKYKEDLMSDASINNILYYDLEIYRMATKIFARQKETYYRQQFESRK